MTLYFVCPTCGEDCRTDDSRYVIDGPQGRYEVGSFVCWMAVVGANKAVLTAAYLSHTPLPEHLPNGTA